MAGACGPLAQDLHSHSVLSVTCHELLGNSNQAK